MEGTRADKEEVLDRRPCLPNNAILEPDRKLFLVRKYAGGTIAKGAFGIHLQTNESLEEGDDDDQEEPINHDEAEESKNATNIELTESERKRSKKKKPNASWYLFIEEVIYLHERGLLEAYDSTEKRLDSRELYQLLPEYGVPLAVFLVYAHLRQQTFKVVRYSSERRKIITEQMQATKKAKFVPQLRDAAATACLPPFEDISMRLSWDVYPPDKLFLKREPGLPSFSVLVTAHAKPFHFSRIRTLVKENEPVNIKLASVADSGIVVLFGVTDIGAPPINSQPREMKAIDNGIDEDEDAEDESMI